MLISHLYKIRQHFLCRQLVAGLVCALILTPVLPAVGYASSPLLEALPQPGTMVHLSDHYEPALIRGMRVFADNPLRFDFIIDVGQSGLAGDELTQETRRLIKYFLAALTVPEDEMWVNLSPYENDRIVPASFGITEMGRDMLAQDYILKQITASLMYPEDDVGKKFWERVYTKAQRLFGTTDIPVNTFNKVWIVPEKAVVYENGDTAYVVRSRLKVMLEEDYLATEASRKPNAAFRLQTGQAAGSEEQSPEVTEIIREVMIPEIEREVNEGEHFRPLRQIYHSMILATWFKRNLRQSFLGRKYVDQKKLSGVDVDDKNIKNKIYQQYLEAFREGAYSYIKEEFDPVTQEVIPRKYFSGGTSLALSNETFEVTRTLSPADRAVMAQTEDRLRIAPTGLELTSPESRRDAAILVTQFYNEPTIENYQQLTAAQRQQIRTQAERRIGSVQVVGRGEQRYAVGDFVRATLEQAAMTKTNVVDRVGEEALFISLGSSPEWIYRSLQLANPEFDRVRYLAFSLLSDNPISEDQAGRYMDYLNDTIGADVRGSTAPIVVSDFLGGGRTFARFVGLLEQWAEREGVEDFSQRLVIHSIEEPGSYGETPEGLESYPVIHQLEMDQEFFEASMNSEAYFNTRWTPRFPPQAWGTERSPFAEGYNIRPTRRAAFLSFLLSEALFGENAVVRPGVLTIGRQKAVLARTQDLDAVTQSARSYQTVEEMYRNLPADIENVIRGFARTLPAEQAAEIERSLPFAMDLLERVRGQYAGLRATDEQGAEINLTVDNYHNHFHNMLVTMGSLIWNMSAGQIENARDFKVAFASALLHDFQLRQVLGPQDANGRRWVTAAYVPETMEQIGDLMGVTTYTRPEVENADYSERVGETDKEGFRRALRGFLGEETSLADFFADVTAAIRRTDFASDVATPEITYQELAGLQRYSLDANIRSWLAGEQTYTQLLDRIAERWDIAFQRVDEDYNNFVYGADNRDEVRNTALTFLRRRQAIDVGFLGALRNIPAERRSKVFELANRLEMADLSGNFWLTSASVNEAVIRGLANELPFVSEEGTYPYFVAQVVSTLRNRAYLEELPAVFQERFIQRVDQLADVAADTVVPRYNRPVADFWAQEREDLVAAFGLPTEERRSVADGKDRAVLSDDGRRMPQNPRTYTVSSDLRTQWVERYGAKVIEAIEAFGKLDNLYSLNRNLQAVVAELDVLYQAAPRKEDAPRLFIRGGIIRRFQAQDLSDLQDNTDIDIILRDTDNYTVRGRQDAWFDNNRTQVMAIPVTPRQDFVEIDRGQLEASPFYLLDLWAAYAGSDRESPEGGSDRAVLVTDRDTPANEVAEQNVGGIDLNPSLLEIQSEGRGIELETPVDMQDLENIQIEGFTPVIFQIVPVTNLPLLLGINDLDNPEGPADSQIQLSAVSPGQLRAADQSL